ncbi:cytochrome C oxidase subunit IV family protein [Pseudomonas sp. Bout1]|uniref:cytochrome C oxidase subunit IV family protein n=1 Tax=unclassified Pseudomonas TaxID=196821 RepID=UPI002AB33321|nr:cytochrome C oxidase subunit IV family protein [Pseudomonas sp. Bout1]MDY7533075.1 cytochrome C oxidase subunit IV family protein [Pseudomonas sp. Bout1]MEB0184444.1 cytochrome C oxidase subunit IV family protein [Pseudomonas sp. Bout1]
MELFFNRLGAVWLALMLATAGGAWVAALQAGEQWAPAAILGLAALKIALVMLWFMELFGAPRIWQAVFGTWLLVVSALLIASFILI